MAKTPDRAAIHHRLKAQGSDRIDTRDHCPQCDFKPELPYVQGDVTGRQLMGRMVHVAFICPRGHEWWSLYKLGEDIPETKPTIPEPPPLKQRPATQYRSCSAADCDRRCVWSDLCTQHRVMAL